MSTAIERAEFAVSNEAAREVLERLRAIAWDDYDLAFSHGRSRALLMREYLRRAALWARELGAESQGLFFDIAAAVQPGYALGGEFEAEVEKRVRGMSGLLVERTCRAAVHWAALRSERADLPDLPDPYEPLLLMYERGGGFYTEVWIELNGISLSKGTVEQNSRAKPFLSMNRATLDALDAEGRITYYAKIGEGFDRTRPRGLVRRRVHHDRVHDEAFTRNLRWEPTEYLRLHELGHNDVDHVEIYEREAAAFIEATINQLSHTR